ncbi:XRE family transcriptional regulator [Haemophilus influenzae]|uniref:XRE family transcriptional regulator n=1 Tax=Haemophilus influenzae TaxID=727 RepID=UPI000DA3D9ED|nr:helix-turn-helix transcriptional regulator [Haemophilus influenzae]RFN92951.1 helix-turn-helix transcriptional regulator [Haemophilus influenzae]SQG36566.1 phage repressor [Haemophilus influenzae]
MSSLANRLKMARKAAGLTQDQLGKLVGVSQNAIQKIEAGGETKYTLALASVLGVDPIWLQSGEGKTPEKNTALSTDLVTTQRDNEHRHRIDYLDVYLAVGISGIENSDYPEIISTLFLSDEGMARLVGKRSSQGVSIVNVPTDSMEPTIRKGDIVFIDTTINCYIGDGIYAFSINGELYIKRIQKLMSGGYRMISDNQAYPSEIISDEIYACAQFVGKFIRTVHIDVMNL